MFSKFKLIGVVDADTIRNRLIFIETLICALPFLILLYIVYQGDYQFDTADVILFCGIAIFVLTGMITLRQILERIPILAQSLKKAESGDTVTIDLKRDVGELCEIATSLNNLLQKLEQTTRALAQRSFELATIRNVAQIVKMNYGMDDQMRAVLEEAMAVTGAQIGSIFMIEPDTRAKSLAATKPGPLCLSQLYRFRVCAAKGHDELEVGSFIGIDDSVVAKAVLLERRPLLIQDISEDQRTSKDNDPKYGPPSFLSLPIFMGDSVLAILNLANKEKGQVFDGNDEQVLSMMLGEMNFALENAMMHSKFDTHLRDINAHKLELEKELEARWRVEETLRDSERKYRELVEFLPIALFEITAEGKVISGNPAIFKTFGYTQEDVDKGLNALQMCRPEDREKAKANIQKILRGEETGGTECTLIRKDGSTFPAVIFGSPIIYRSIPVGMRGAIIDITGHKSAS